LKNTRRAVCALTENLAGPLDINGTHARQAES